MRIARRFGRPPNGYEVRNRRTSGAAVGTPCMIRAVRTAHVDLSVSTYATMLVEPDHEHCSKRRLHLLWSVIMAAGPPASSQRPDGSGSPARSRSWPPALLPRGRAGQHGRGSPARSRHPAREVACADSPHPRLTLLVRRSHRRRKASDGVRTSERTSDTYARTSGQRRRGTAPAATAPAAALAGLGGSRRSRRSRPTIWRSRLVIARPAAADRCSLAHKAVHAGLPNHQEAPASKVYAK